MLKPGKYTAKLTDYAMGTTKTGKPQFLAVFAVGDETITYRGTMESDKQKSFNLRTMADLGLSAPEDLVNVVDGPDGGALELGCEVSITVETREHNGKTYTDVKWINPINASKFSNDPAEKAQAKMSLASLTGELAAILASRGVTKRTPEVPF